MASPGELFRDVAQRADARALAALYAAVSVSTPATQAWLRERGLPFLDAGAPAPRLIDVDRTADHVIDQTRANTAALGAFTGLAGWLTVPPEVVGWIVACLRMGQRLAVVYGFDPQTDRGHVAVSRAIAAGFEAELPERGLVGMRLSELARSMVGDVTPDARKMGGQLARTVVVRSARLAMGRVGRLLPVVASGVSASGNHQEAARVGERMKQTLRKLATAPEAASDRIVEAVEIVPDVP